MSLFSQWLFLFAFLGFSGEDVTCLFHCCYSSTRTVQMCIFPIGVHDCHSWGGYFVIVCENKVEKMWQGVKHYLDPNNERWELLIIEGWRQTGGDRSAKFKALFWCRKWLPSCAQVKAKEKKIDLGLLKYLLITVGLWKSLELRWNNIHIKIFLYRSAGFKASHNI